MINVLKINCGLLPEPSLSHSYIIISTDEQGGLGKCWMSPDQYPEWSVLILGDSFWGL